jgi:hypothetical protein
MIERMWSDFLLNMQSFYLCRIHYCEMFHLPRCPPIRVSFFSDLSQFCDTLWALQIEYKGNAQVF